MGARRVRAALAGALLCAGTAQADEFDTLNVDIGSTFISNSDVFYLPAGADPNVVLGKPTRSDFTSVNSLGIRLAKPYSLQRFELSASFVDYRYKTFDFLNYSATNYAAAWRWSLTPRFYGNLTANRTQSLNSFLDFRTFVKNVRTEESQRFDGEFEIDGGLRAIGAVASYRVRNALLFVAQGDLEQATVEAGLRYKFPSGSQLTYVARGADGKYTNRNAPDFANVLDNKYSQSEHEVRLLWAFTGKSSLESRATFTERRHPNLPQRDYSGLGALVKLDWGITGKTRLQASVSRELASFLLPTSSYTRLDKFTLGPSWEISPKLLGRLRYEVSERTFLGPVVPVTQTRVDTINTMYIGLDWQPRRWVTVSASLQNDRRNSNLPGLDFVSNTALLAAQLTF
jgi:exopolysaccharide biosynthesis operon protein EpsL